MGKRKEIAFHTLIVASGTFLSRVLGLVRDILIASFFGTSPQADAFFVAFRIPNLFRRLIGEGALWAAFIPVFAEVESEKRNVQSVLSSALSSMLVFVLPLTLLSLFYPQLFVGFVSPGFLSDADLFRLTSNLTRITFFFIFFMSLAILYGAYLNYRKKFIYTSLSPVFLNISFIFFILAFIDSFKVKVFCLAWAVFFGGLLQLFFQMYGIINQGLNPLSLGKPFSREIKEAVRLMLPSVLGFAIHQINILFDTIIASFLPKGSIAYLYYANRFFQFPLALFGISAGTVMLSHFAEAVVTKKDDTFGNMKFSLTMIFILNLPAAVGLFMLAEDIVDVLFKRGAFNEVSVYNTAIALKMYVLGLVFISMSKVFVSFFQAHKNIDVIIKGSVLSFLINLVLNIILAIFLKHAGLALATSVASFFYFVFLFYQLKKRYGAGFNSIFEWLVYIEVILSSLFMAFVISLVIPAFQDLPKFLELLAVIISAAFAYFGVLITFAKAYRLLKRFGT